MNYDDSDMKIVSGRLSKLFDTGEGAATAFAREKANGNMDRARKLGLHFAEDLLRGEQGPAQYAVGAFDDEHTKSQRRVLFTYVVNRVIEDMAPNSMVAQSALSAFYDLLQEKEQALYDEVNDSAAFSLYILTARSAPDDPCALGKVFARLCGHENEALYVEYGCELSEHFSLYCTEVVLAAGFIR